MNLIFAELIMAIFGIPINFTASLMHGWKLGQTMCSAFGFALTLEGKIYKQNVEFFRILSLYQDGLF